MKWLASLFVVVNLLMLFAAILLCKTAVNNMCSFQYSEDLLSSVNDINYRLTEYIHQKNENSLPEFPQYLTEYDLSTYLHIDIDTIPSLESELTGTYVILDGQKIFVKEKIDEWMIKQIID